VKEREKDMTAESTMVSRKVDSGFVSNSALILLGRFFFAFIFLLVGPNLFTKAEIAADAAQGIPFASVAVPLAGAISLVGGLSVLLGYRAKIGAWLMVLFLVVVTPSMHKFWGLADPKVAQLQMVMFLKNLSILGGAFLITQFGAGPLSLDSRRAHRTRNM
jgi:putative oxidoreductase